MKFGTGGIYIKPCEANLISGEENKVFFSGILQTIPMSKILLKIFIVNFR
jgi:hypothetical protein